MDETLAKILHVIPEKWRTTALVAVAAIPYGTRAYHALASGGGLRGIYRSILFGTNTPKQNPESSNEKPQS